MFKGKLRARWRTLAVIKINFVVWNKRLSFDSPEHSLGASSHPTYT